MGGITKDDSTDKLMYYAKDLDSQYLMEFEIKEIGIKYPSDFLYGILMDNGYIPFSKGETYKYDEDFLISNAVTGFSCDAVFEAPAVFSKALSGIWRADGYTKVKVSDSVAYH